MRTCRASPGGEYAYTILDVSGELSPAAVEALRGLEPIVKVRVIQ